MPTKSTKTATKSESKRSKLSEKKSISKISENKSIEKKESTKKVVVKRRKTDLKPTRASAVAIASQANRAKKQALIEKFATSDGYLPKNVARSSDNKIPLWVWIFFWCSLLLFCISFYYAIFRPQLEVDVIDENWIIESFVDWDDTVILDDDYQVVDNQTVENTVVAEEVPATATEVIQAFFSRLSDRKFDEAFDLMIPVLRNSSEIRDHFTSFRMNPLLDWIEWWKLVPLNFEYVKSPAYWKDVYKFDLSYVMSADKTKYDETWEFTVNSQWNEPKISSIRCTTNKCSYHPIFWPENFGLMR